ncbi:MAG: energy transducer TonB [Pseudolabrys sp.]|nr:energy transducer TonB [Pseudolabrys sp.]
MSFREHRAEYLRWGLCFAAVTIAHVAGAAILIARAPTDDLLANAPVITVDLAPVAATPENTPTDIPLGPQQVETPQEEPPPPPPTDVSVEPPKPPPPKPPEKKKVAKLTTAPAPAEHRAPVAAAPAPGASGSNAVPNWKSQLVSVLERNKRYPSEARARGDQGVAQVAFSVDRSGGVHNVRITRSSGSSALDSETLSLVQRVSPLPPPPAEMGGGQIAIAVPIRYSVR